MRIRDLVTGLPPLRLSDDDAAVAQAREVIRDVRPRQFESPRQNRRIAGAIQQREKNARTGRIGHRPSEPVHHVDARSNSQHTLTIQRLLTLPKRG